MWTPQKPIINLQMLVFHRSQRLAAFMVQWQGKHFIHCVQTMTPMLTQHSSKTIAFGFIHWVILGRELGSHGLWTRMIEDHSNAWRGCTAKPRSIQSYRLLESWEKESREIGKESEQYIFVLWPLGKIFWRMSHGAGHRPHSAQLTGTLSELSVMLSRHLDTASQLSLCTYSQVCKLAALHLHPILQAWHFASFFRYHLGFSRHWPW